MKEETDYKMTKRDKYLAVLLWSPLVLVALAYLFDVGDKKEFTEIVFKGYALLFFGSLTLAVFGGAFLLLLASIGKMWEEMPNKLLATIAIIIFLGIFASSFIFDSGWDNIPYARILAR